MSEMESEFQDAANAVQNLRKRPDNETLLRLYALFKQASSGDVSGKRPGFTDFVGRAKYDAWKALKGKPKEEAMGDYVELAAALKADEEADE